jgi:Ca2+-binding EF-hand superfamily protein
LGQTQDLGYTRSSPNNFKLVKEEVISVDSIPVSKDRSPGGRRGFSPERPVVIEKPLLPWEQPRMMEEIVTTLDYDPYLGRDIETVTKKTYVNEAVQPVYASPSKSYHPYVIPSMSETRSPQPYYYPSIDGSATIGSQGNRIQSTFDYVHQVRRESDRLSRFDEVSHRLALDTKFSSLTTKEKNDLIDTLKVRLRLLRELERARYVLCEFESFSVYELFHLLNRRRSNLGINYEDFRLLFHALNIVCDEKHIKLIFIRADVDQDGLLNMREFGEVFCPFNPEMRDSVARRKDVGYSSVHDYSALIKKNIDASLLALISYERETDETREVTQHKVYSLFNLLDGQNKGSVVLADIAYSFGEHGIAADEREIINLMRSFDGNQDGKLTLLEFTYQLSPFRNSIPFETIRSQGF